MSFLNMCAFFFFFNDTATTEIYTLSLHDALPISLHGRFSESPFSWTRGQSTTRRPTDTLWPRYEQSKHAEISGDRKSTRLNSSHSQISYAVFCLKKKNRNGPHEFPARPAPERKSH